MAKRDIRGGLRGREAPRHPHPPLLAPDGQIFKSGGSGSAAPPDLATAIGPVFDALCVCAARPLQAAANVALRTLDQEYFTELCAGYERRRGLLVEALRGGELAEEAEMMSRWGQVTKAPELKAASSGEELLNLRQAVDNVHVSEAVQGYILSLVRGTRALTVPDAKGYRLLSFGASPRASLALYQASRALAWLRGQDFVSPSLIQDVAHDVLRHRVGLTYEAEAADKTSDQIISELLDKTPVPAAE
jgi:hypothetical protein